MYCIIACPMAPKKLVAESSESPTVNDPPPPKVDATCGGCPLTLFTWGVSWAPVRARVASSSANVSL